MGCIYVFERDAVGEMGEVTGGVEIFDNLCSGCGKTCLLWLIESEANY
jgi:uncharacterized cysteine cluster protein YcgN (CxxCxxCC family)